MAGNAITRRSARVTAALILSLAAVAAGAQQITVRAAVDRQVVDVGDPFRFQIAVSGSDQVTPPDLNTLRDFTVRALSAGPNNSESVTVINGNTTREVRRGYVLNYQLTATKSGTLTIPALTVAVAAQQRQTPAISIEVREPRAVEGYRLHLALDREQVWAGQPVLLTTTWMWDPRLGPERFHQLSYPLLAGPASKTGVTFEHLHPATTPDDPVRLQVAGEEVVWRRGETSIDGDQYLTLSFATTLVPQRPGTLAVAPATVVFDGIAGYRNSRDVFGRAVRQPVSQRFVVPSNELSLRVEPLPEAGRPAAFTGLVGSFTIAAEATPTQVKVGDPIELTVTIAGSGDLRRLPPLDLSRMEGFERFRVSDAAAVPATFDRAAIRRTIRALSHETDAIPPVSMVVFDVASGRYTELASEPIPLTVQATRQVTLQDVEGAATGTTFAGAAVASRDQGIAHNYAGSRLLKQQRFDAAAFATSPGGLFALLAAPLLLAVLHAWAALRRRRQRAPRPAAALGRLRRSVHDADTPKRGTPAGDAACILRLHDALLAYLAERLMAGRTVHGYADVADTLQARGAGERAADELRDLLGALEAVRYGGTGADSRSLAADLVAWATRLEEILRQS